MLVVGRVDDGDLLAAEGEVDALAARIIAGRPDFGAYGDARRRLQRHAFEGVELARRCRDIEPVVLGVASDADGLCQAFHGLDDGARGQIDDGDLAGAVLQHEEPLIGEIEGEIVDGAGSGPERKAADLGERRRKGAACGHQAGQGDRNGQTCARDHATTFCVCSPSPATPRRMLSPGFKKRGGFMPMPTPGGVPVVMMSPGWSDMNWLT